MKLLNIIEAAELLNCSTRTIHRYIKLKRLRAIRPAHSQGVPYCFHIKDLYAFYLFRVDKVLKTNKSPEKRDFGAIEMSKKFIYLSLK
tara:strand:+ start:479 stop:742 length:264 start_codon:yes stop_codon:yes gene_type:complete